MSIINFVIEHKWAVITFVGALIVAGGALKASIDQQKSEKEANKLSVELQNKTEEIRKLQELTIYLQNENNRELSHQKNMITGGNSYPLILITQEPEKPYLYKAMLWVSGKYPLFNFSMSIRYRNGKNKGKKIDYKMDEVRQISPTYFTPDLTFDLREDPNLELYIRFFARNGGWDEVIKFRRTDDGEYQREIKLTTHHGQKEPIVFTKFEDNGVKFGSLQDIQSLE